MLNNYDMCAAALYDGEWRSSDGATLMAEYGLTREEVDELCVRLAEIENDL